MAETLYSLIENDLPEGKQNLINFSDKLLKLSVFCENNFEKSQSKPKALEETKHYVAQALSNIASQLNFMATNFNQLIDIQSLLIKEMEYNVNHISQRINIIKEKIYRREIGVLTTNKIINRHYKIVSNKSNEDHSHYKYIRKPIDFTELDNIGHGMVLNVMDNINNDCNHLIDDRHNSLDNYCLNINTNNIPPLRNKLTSRYTMSSNSSLSPHGVLPYGNNFNNLNSSINQMNINDISINLDNPYHPYYGISNNKTNNQYFNPSQHITSSSDYINNPELNNSNIDYHSRNMNINANNINLHQSLPYNHQNHERSNIDPMLIGEDGVFLNTDLHYSHGIDTYQEGHYDISRARAPMFNVNMGDSLRRRYTNTYHNNEYIVNKTRDIGSCDLYQPLPCNSNHYDKNFFSPNMGQTNPYVLNNTRNLLHANNVTNQTPQNINFDVYDKRASVPAPDSYIQKVIALYDYQMEKEDELSFKENETIYVVKKNEDGWWEGLLDGKRGLFPGNYVEPI